MILTDHEAELKTRIYCDHIAVRAREIFELHGLSVDGTLDDAAVLWISAYDNPRAEDIFQNLLPGQLFNHFYDERAIINKARLLQTLRNFETSGLKGADEISFREFFPESYCLFDPVDRSRFFDQLPAQDSPDNPWIIKPDTKSGGEGVRVTWQLGDLRDIYATNDDPLINAEREIIQRYITNPLLLNGRKSEIRIYWLVASIDPMLVLLFDEGTVRLNTLPFKLGDFDNQLIHITNELQQKNHPDYDPDAVLKWSFLDLNQYLLKVFGVKEPDFIHSVLFPKLKKYLAHIMRASRTNFMQDYPRKGDCFAVYGADVILDDRLDPWITEIQGGPGLSFDDPIKKVVLPPMLEEAIHIMLEIRSRRIAGESLTNLHSVDRFQWVINEASKPVFGSTQNLEYLGSD